jgi:hypothetical protein
MKTEIFNRDKIYAVICVVLYNLNLCLTGGPMLELYSKLIFDTVFTDTEGLGYWVSFTLGVCTLVGASLAALFITRMPRVGLIYFSMMTQFIAMFLLSITFYYRLGYPS